MPFAMALLIALGLLLLLSAVGLQAMPDGPPLQACTLMRPQHPNTIEQTSELPVEVVHSFTYTPGGVVPVTIALRPTETMQFRGFMIQARPADDPNSSPLGSFTISAASIDKAKTIDCSTPDSTAAHSNPDLESVVIVEWNSPTVAVQDAEPIKFYYTIVANFSTYWVMRSTNTVTVEGQVATTDGGTTDGATTAPPDEGTTGMQSGEDTNKTDTKSTNLIKAHGSVMAFTWGFIAPAGILLALYYKVIWPNGEWFYAHIAIMCTALGGTLLGIILIVAHAEGKWLSTTSLNLPHQVLGIITTVAVGVNPFLAIIRCDPQSEWRWIYNWAHGSIGLIMGQSTALVTMLLGLYVFRELASDEDLVHIAIYLLSSIVGVAGAVAIMFNIYAITFHKTNPKPSDEDEEDDQLQPSRDYPLRAGFGIVVLVVLLLLAIGTTALISSA